MRRGQILLVVFLGMAVMLTVGLSVVSRSVNEVSQATTQDDSVKALSAAESGVEAAIGKVATEGVLVNVSSESKYTVISSNVLDTKKDSVVFPDLLAGEAATLILYDSSNPYVSTFDLNKQFNICWGTIGQVSPRLEVIAYYHQAGVYKMSTLGNFLNPETGSNPCTRSGESDVYANHAKMKMTDFGLSGSDTPIYLRIRMLDNQVAQHLAVRHNTNSDNFPSQGMRVKVLGQSGSTSRVVEVTQSLGVPLGIFDQAVFSGLNLGN